MSENSFLSLLPSKPLLETRNASGEIAFAVIGKQLSFSQWFQLCDPHEGYFVSMTGVRIQTKETLWLFMVVMMTLSLYCASEQVCSVVYPQLVLGAHGNPGGLSRCLLCCR